MNFLALDLGDTTGIAFGDPRERKIPVSKTLRMMKEGEHASIATKNLLAFLRDYLSAKPMTVVGIEKHLAPHLLRKVNIAEIVMYMSGAAQGYAKLCGCQVELVGVATIRKHFIGKGNLTSVYAKAAVLARCHQLGYIPKSDDSTDRSDACALWDYLVHKHTKEAMPFEMMEVL